MLDGGSARHEKNMNPSEKLTMLLPTDMDREKRAHALPGVRRARGGVQTVGSHPSRFERSAPL